MDGDIQHLKWSTGGNSLGSDSGGISEGERAVAREDDHQSLASPEP